MPYAFIDITPDVAATWKVINQSRHNAVDRLTAITSLLKDNVGQLELKELEAQLLFVALRELKGLKTLAGVQTIDGNNANSTFDAKANELFDLLDVEIAYCEKSVKFSPSLSEFLLANQQNRGRLSRVQLYATQAFDYVRQWHADTSDEYKKRLTALKTISGVLAKFETAQQDFLKTVKSVKPARKSLNAKRKATPSQSVIDKSCSTDKPCCLPPKSNRNMPYPPDLFAGQPTPLKPD